jgi:hypothetical protein
MIRREERLRRGEKGGDWGSHQEREEAIGEEGRGKEAREVRPGERGGGQGSETRGEGKRPGK